MYIWMYSFLSAVFMKMKIVNKEHFELDLPHSALWSLFYILKKKEKNQLTFVFFMESLSFKPIK